MIPEDGGSGAGNANPEKDAAAFKINRITMLLRLDSLASIFTFINLLGGEAAPQAPRVHKAKQKLPEIEEEPSSPSTSQQNSPLLRSTKRPLEVHGLRIVELTQRTSTVMKVSEVDEFTDRDPVLNAFRTFGRLNHLAVSAGISIAPEDSFAEVLTERATDRSSELLLVPWSETGTISDPQDPQNVNLENRFTSSIHNRFIHKVLNHATCSTAILVNRGFGGIEKTLTRSVSIHSLKLRNNGEIDQAVAPIADPSHHIFFPFFGGVDDRLALQFVLQLAQNSNVTATVVNVVFKKDANENLPALPELPAAVASRRDLPRGLSLSNVPSLATLENSTTTESTGNDDAFFQSLLDSLPAGVNDRVFCDRVETNHPLHYTIAKAKQELGTSNKNAGDLLVLGRSVNSTKPYIRSELMEVLGSLGNPTGAGSDMRKCLGDMAEAIIVSNVKASVLVLQARGKVVDAVAALDSAAARVISEPTNDIGF